MPFYKGSAWCALMRAVLAWCPFIRAVIGTFYNGSDWCPFIRAAFSALL